MVEVKGLVIRGAGVGQGLGFPTINLDYGETKPDLEHGVYCCRVLIPGFGDYFGALNFGRRMSFGAMREQFEVYVLDFSGDLYGVEVTVLVDEKLREVMKFGSIELLKQQIAEDVAKVRGFYNLN